MSYSSEPIYQMEKPKEGNALWGTQPEGGGHKPPKGRF